MFLCRVNSYIKNGWATKVINPDIPSAFTSHTSIDNNNEEPFTGQWLSIQTAFSQADKAFTFTYGHMITCFVSRNVVDGMAAGDFKSINTAANDLFEGGHVQNIEIGKSEHYIHIKSNCLPEMHKDRVYKILLSLHNSSYDIATACCGCPAGKGPTASCKHIGALCYALVSFCRLRSLPDFVSCTEKLQEWNHPRPRKAEAIPVIELNTQRNEIKKKEVSLSFKEYNPQPLGLKVDQPQLVENMRVTLLEQKSAFSQLLMAPVSIALKDHTYCTTEERLLLPSQLVTTSMSLEQMMIDYYPPPDFEKDSLNVTAEERVRIEMATRDQSQSAEWHMVRSRRITGSTCGKLLNQKEPTPALLQCVLYPKPFINLPAAVKWGIDHEPHANRAYLQYAKKHGKHRLTTKKCGFIVHPTMGFLGASPDARVSDPHCELTEGIAEFKCPYSKREVLPVEACSDSNFYCHYKDGSFCLKDTDEYYHQVQLQLYVRMDLYYWCDFCVFTLKGVEVQRIWLDTSWCNKYIPELESYFDAYMLPEILHPS